MKLFNKYLIPGLAATAVLAVVPACSEDDTLSGAKEVYITLDPSSISLCSGDTVKLNVSVSNISGDEIDTPVTWSTDDSSIARIVEFRDTVFEAGDTVYTALPDSSKFYIERLVKSIGDKLYYGIVGAPGAQGMSTKYRATLSNGRFAVGTVNVINHSPSGVTPVSESVRTYRPSSVEVTDTVWFNVDPWAILGDFTPTAKLDKTDDGPSELTLADDYIYIDNAGKRVGVLLKPDRSHGEYDLTLSVGGNGDVLTGIAHVVVGPNIKVGMWDPDIEGMSPPTGDQFYGFNYEVRKNLDINQETKIWARLMVEGGRTEDVANAKNSYKWEVESGNSLLIVAQDEIPNEYGFDCVLTVRSGGVNQGDNVINFCSPDTAALVMKAYITVENWDIAHPVNDIIITPDNGMSLDNLVVSAGSNLQLDVRVDPLTSLAYHRPEVVIENPDVLEFASYSGTSLTLRGSKPGTTKVTVSSLQITKSFNVTVTDEITEMSWSSGVDNMVKGQSAEFSVAVRTASGLPNSLPVVWTSSNETVATVTGNSSTATVKAIGAGAATITAKITSPSGKVTSVTRTVDVAVGIDDIIVSEETKGETGDAGYYSQDGRYYFYVSLPDHGYQNISIYTKNQITDLNGPVTLDKFAEATVDGAAATVTASTLVISNANGGEATANGEITLSMGGVPVKIVYKNVTIYY